MSNERLKEIKNIMLTPHLDMYLSNACNELFQYVIKQKEVLDKIKKLTLQRKHCEDLFGGKEKTINDRILELLEEIE